MPKRGALQHPKTQELADRLGISPPHALGLLNGLWDHVGDHAQDGDITHLRPGHVCRVIFADVDPLEFWAALIDTRFVDQVDGKLLIHDWYDHAEDWVHISLARKVRRFADGSIPKMSRLSQVERKQLEQAFEQEFGPESLAVRTKAPPSAGSAHSMRTDHAQRAHCHALPKPKPCTEPPPKPPQGVLGSGEVGEGEKVDFKPNPVQDLPRLPEADLKAIEALLGIATRNITLGSSEALALRQLWADGCTLGLFLAAVEEKQRESPGFQAGSLSYYAAMARRLLKERRDAPGPERRDITAHASAFSAVPPPWQDPSYVPPLLPCRGSLPPRAGSLRSAAPGEAERAMVLRLQRNGGAAANNAHEVA